MELIPGLEEMPRDKAIAELMKLGYTEQAAQFVYNVAIGLESGEGYD